MQHEHNIAKKVNEQLPCQITAEDVERYPEFTKLLHALTQHIDEDGLDRSTKSDVLEAESSLKHAKSKYLENQIVYTELKELLLDHQMNTGHNTPSSSSKFYKAVQECVTHAELGDYLKCHPDPSSEVTLLGLSEDDVHRLNPHRKHLPSIQQKLIPEIEARLRKRCEALVNFHSKSNSNTISNDAFTFSKATQLPALVETEKLSLAEEKRLLKKDRKSREKQFWQYYQVLLESLNILEKLISRHRLENQAENDKITSEWLVARCDTMHLKVKMLELRLLCDTYYTETVIALSTVRDALDKKILETNKELHSVRQSLTAYEQVGLGFDGLVMEYTHMKDEIDNKKWALRELKHSIENDDT